MEEIVSRLKNYVSTPSLLTFNIFAALFDNNIIDSTTYRMLKKEWNKIQYIQDELGASHMTHYEEFTYHLNKLIKKEWNWHYTIGSFPIPNGTVKVLLKCCGNILNKQIHILAYQNETIFEIERRDKGMLYRGFESAQELCRLLNKLNQCKNCRIVSVNIGGLGYCQPCRNKAATVIQMAWRECISNPDYYICRKRLMEEFNGLVEDEQ